MFKHQTLETEKKRPSERFAHTTAVPMTEGALMETPAKKLEIIKQEIDNFLTSHDDDNKIDKHYVLFLFQIYEYQEGVKNCCERLNLKQELLNFYMQKGESDRVLEVCMNYKDGDLNGDLWIQALLSLIHI